VWLGLDIDALTSTNHHNIGPAQPSNIRHYCCQSDLWWLAASI